MNNKSYKHSTVTWEKDSLSVFADLQLFYHLEFYSIKLGHEFERSKSMNSVCSKINLKHDNPSFIILKLKQHSQLNTSTEHSNTIFTKF